MYVQKGNKDKNLRQTLMLMQKKLKPFYLEIIPKKRINVKENLTHSTSFSDLEMVPIFFFVFHTRGYLGRGPLASHT